MGRLSKKIKCICLQCEKEFESLPSRGKFCSTNCSYLFRKKRIKHICLQCEKEFEVLPSRDKNGGGKFCSQKCSGLYHQKRIKHICLQCEKEFETIPYSGGKFCSSKCRYLSMKNNVKHICLQCDEEFEIPLSFTKKGGGKFCSSRCRYLYYNENKVACLQCGEEFKALPSRTKKGHDKFCSTKCKGLYFRIYPDTEKQKYVRTMAKYINWKYKVNERDKYVCQKCGKSNLQLHAHHIVPFSILFLEYSINSIEQAEQCDAMWDINNGITLCGKCHRKQHKKAIKKGLTQLSLF